MLRAGLQSGPWLECVRLGGFKLLFRINGVAMLPFSDRYLYGYFAAGFGHSYYPRRLHFKGPGIRSSAGVFSGWALKGYLAGFCNRFRSRQLCGWALWGTASTQDTQLLRWALLGYAAGLRASLWVGTLSTLLSAVFLRGQTNKNQQTDKQITTKNILKQLCALDPCHLEKSKDFKPSCMSFLALAADNIFGAPQISTGTRQLQDTSMNMYKIRSRHHDSRQVLIPHTAPCLRKTIQQRILIGAKSSQYNVRDLSRQPACNLSRNEEQSAKSRLLATCAGAITCMDAWQMQANHDGKGSVHMGSAPAACER